MQHIFTNKAIAFVRRYKLLHILFWIWNYIDLVHMMNVNSKHKGGFYIDAFNIKIVQLVCVYFIVYYLMPRTLQQKKYTRFAALALVTVLAASLLTSAGQEVISLVQKGRLIRTFMLPVLFISNLTETAVISFYFFAVYAVQYTYITERRNQMLEKERLETELNFLKAQINPHFLFNAINSIYVLIDEDKRLASQTLLKFSGLLRYQLYDCTHNSMPLARELEFLHDYIELEKVRTSDNLTISFHNNTMAGYHEIAPFILIPFVENAFKHRSHSSGSNFVNIRTEVLEDVLIFTVTNTYDEGPVPDKTDGGIGLQNAHRRLELLYKDRHELIVIKADGVYSVNLQLQLHENAMHIS